MAGRSIFGSSVSMNNEFNFKGKKTEIKSPGKVCTPVKMGDREQTVDIASFVPLVLGTIPVCSGTRQLSSMEQSVMGALSVAGTIQITKDPQTAQYMFNYILSLLKVVNGASARNGKLSEDEIKKLLMALMGKWLEASGPGFTSYKQLLMDLMQNATLQDFMKGMQDAVCAMTGDPVNANTGNFIYEKEDLLLKGRIPLRFKRFYNSTDQRTGAMGKGWRHNYEIQLLQENDRYIILWEDGREEIYLREKGNISEPLFGLPCRLRQEKEGYRYETQEMTIYSFDNKGKLCKQEDPNGQGLFFTYDKRERLSRISNNNGAFLNFEYDSLGRFLYKVTDHTGRCVTFTYEMDRLKEVKNAAGQTYVYDYGPDKRIRKIRNPRGIYVLENSYDERGRTTVQRFADGGEIRYDYQENLSRTLVTEQNGNKVAYVHDERFRNVKTIYIDGEERFTYNDRNQLVSKTDKNGNRTKISYDDKGNTTQIIFPDGAKHNMTYDASNHLISMSVNGIQKVKNTYDAKGNLIKITDALGRCRKVAYDKKGNAIKIELPDGSTAALDYDDNGNITRIAEASGRCLAYEYDSCNRAVCTIDGNGNRTRFTYDACNQITSITNAAGKCRTYEYSKNGKLIGTTDFNGAITRQEYNAMNQVKSLTRPDGGTTCMEYDQMQNLTKKILPNGAEISYEYDSLNRMEHMLLPTGGVVRYEYDPKGNRTAVIDPEGNRTSMEYDERDRLTKVTDPSGASKKYEYDLDGFLICVTNAAGKSHTYTYDKAGNVISETDISGNTTSYEYNELNKLTSVTDPKKRKTVYEYAPGGILRKTIYPDGAFETYTYDKNGNQIRRQNHKGDFLELAYDCLNRLTSVKNSFDQQVGYTYNANGAVTSVTDPLGNVTCYDYSAEGKLTSVVDAAGNRTEYAYDAMGGLITICQHQGRDILLKHDRNAGVPGPGDSESIHYTNYKRNLLGNVETVINPLGLQEHYSYDLLGRMTLKRDREGFETRYAYNPVGDIESVTYADGRKAAFTYNPLRQLTEIRDWLGTTRIEPDDMGRAKKVTDYRGQTTSYQWGIMGEMETLLYPNGKKVFYEYDDLSRLTKLTDGMQEIRYQYNEDGRLCEKILPDGITSSYQYNPMGLLSKLVHRKDGEILEQYGYEYDRMCNKIGIHKKRSAAYLGETALKEAERLILDENGYYQYKYDRLNRLTEVRKNRGTLRSYEYDAFGNRVQKRTAEGCTNYHYNAANQLIRTEGILPEEIYQYDARGNVTAICQGGRAVRQYIYDETNRLSEAFNSDGAAARYEYDGLGNRTGMQEYLLDNRDVDSASLTELVWPKSPAKEEDYLLDLTKQYHNLLEKTEISEELTNTQSYTWDSNAVFMTEGESAHIYLQDELGSTVRTVSIQENQQNVYGYDEFGLDLFGNQREGQPFGYTGYRKDDITNTYFAQAREYRPEVGRFEGEDKAKGSNQFPTTLNYYQYVLNQPLNLVDLNGAWPEWIDVSEKGAEKKIKDNSEYILKAAVTYGVDPKTVAGVIYAEQSLNVDIVDMTTDWVSFYGVIDMSVGIGQVRMSTAELLEELGYVDETKAEEGGWDIPFVGFVHGTTTMAREKRLEDNEKNILYVAAYIKLIEDTWKKVFSQISTRPDIIGTLYNQGHDFTSPHSNPGSNDFGKYVLKNYNKMGGLLGICETSK